MSSLLRHSCYRTGLTLILFGVFLGLSSSSLAANTQIKAFSLKERQFLVNTFQKEGFSPHYLKKVFYDQRLQKYKMVVSRNIYNQEDKRNYANFLTPYSTRKAYRFSRKWRTLLARAQKKFGVDKEVIVAILLVETGLGSTFGQYPTLSVYTSMVTAHHQFQRQQRKPKKLETQEEKYFRERLAYKANWARKELKSLLTLGKEKRLNIFSLKGSFSGAFGLPQFLPSSYQQWGKDYDNDGTINLFWVPDAVYSTANYLQKHGWTRGLHRKSNRKAVWEYNHSDIYVDTVLTVASNVKYRTQPQQVALKKK